MRPVSPGGIRHRILYLLNEAPRSVSALRKAEGVPAKRGKRNDHFFRIKALLGEGYIAGGAGSLRLTDAGQALLRELDAQGTAFPLEGSVRIYRSA